MSTGVATKIKVNWSFKVLRGKETLLCAHNCCWAERRFQQDTISGQPYSSSHLAHDIENPRIFAKLELHLCMSVIDSEDRRPCRPRVFFSSLLRRHRHNLIRRYVLGALQTSCTSRFMINIILHFLLKKQDYNINDVKINTT